MQRKNELRMQETYQQLLDAEQQRMENEYEQRSTEMAQKWKAQLDEEKHRLQKVNELFSLIEIHSMFCRILIELWSMQNKHVEKKIAMTNKQSSNR